MNGAIAVRVPGFVKVTFELEKKAVPAARAARTYEVCEEEKIAPEIIFWAANNFVGRDGGWGM